MFTLPTTVFELQSREELEGRIQKAEKLIVSFSTDWCPPCKVMEGTISNLSFELEGKAEIIKIDPEKFPELASKYNLKTIPYYIGFVNSEINGKAHGIVPIKMLKGLINEY